MGTCRGMLKSRSSGGTCSTNRPMVRNAQSSHVEYLLVTDLPCPGPSKEEDYFQFKIEDKGIIRTILKWMLQNYFLNVWT